MSSAPKHAASAAFAHAEGRERGHAWERILAVLLVCLPIPLLAATGLSIPIPAGVERIGAALVVWTEEADASPFGESGEIVLAGGEEGPPEGLERSGVAQQASAASVATPTAGSNTSGASTPAGGAREGGKPKEEDGGGGGGGSGPTNPGTEDPPDEPGLVEGTVKEVSKATEPVVDEVDETLGALLPTDELLPSLGG